MARPALTLVREQLRMYADRGVLRGLNEATSGSFNFVWMMGRGMQLRVDTAKHVLRFRQLLPGVHAGSPMYAELKNFMRERHDRGLPDHRRVDPRRAEARCYNRGGFVSISLKVKRNQYAYGLKKIINVVHELFVHLRDLYPDYLAENFDVSNE